MATSSSRQSSPTAAPETLARYLGERLGGGGVVELERLKAGHSNLTYKVRRGSDTYVLRRPPAGNHDPTAHDVLREYRVLSNLEHTEARTPKPVLACDDRSIIGAPFYLMEYVNGIVLRDGLDDQAVGVTARHRIGLELVETLTEIHDVEWRATGFKDRPPRSGYLERQLALWSGQWTRNRTRELDAIDRVGRWLRENLPANDEITVVHGDFKLDNVIFDEGPGHRALAVLDWEMATLGDPLADVGFMSAMWTESEDAPSVLLALGAATLASGFCTQRELLEHYARLTGRDLSSIGWYRTLAMWKLAILLEASYRRRISGLSDDPFFDSLESGIPQLAAHAEQLAHD